MNFAVQHGINVRREIFPGKQGISFEFHVFDNEGGAGLFCRSLFFLFDNNLRLFFFFRRESLRFFKIRLGLRDRLIVCLIAGLCGSLGFTTKGKNRVIA
jgi:hypothetical protein